MKLISALLFTSVALAQNAAIGQPPTPARPTTRVHTASATHAGAASCVKLPDLSSKLPALPANAPCAKALYTITTVPNVKLEYVSPQEGTALNDFLGIGTTSFTLAYIDTKVGTGELAAPQKYYSIQYTGYLADGTKFDSSYDRGTDPFSFQMGQHQVVAGWDTGFAGMRVGGKRRLFIPFELAYGPQGRPPTIPAKAELIFDLEFMGQSDKAPEPKTPQAPPQPASNAPAGGHSGGAPAAADEPSTPGAPASTPQSSTTPSTTAPATTPAKPQ